MKSFDSKFRHLPFFFLFIVPLRLVATRPRYSDMRSTRLFFRFFFRRLSGSTSSRSSDACTQAVVRHRDRYRRAPAPRCTATFNDSDAIIPAPRIPRRNAEHPSPGGGNDRRANDVLSCVTSSVFFGRRSPPRRTDDPPVGARDRTAHTTIPTVPPTARYPATKGCRL